jgi:hypothetical protein
MIYIEIDGCSDTITLFRSVGFDLISISPNPHPQPYYFALMCLNTKYADSDFILDSTFRDFVYSKITNKSLDLVSRMNYAKELEIYINKGNINRDMNKQRQDEIRENEIPF